MPVLTPRELRESLEQSKGKIQLLAGVLEHNTSEASWGLGDACRRTADELRSILRSNEVPDDYKVAVVGRFKAGKSAFVNELLERRLAGEDTSPETAAITTFRNGDSVEATVRFMPAERWEAIRSAYDGDPKDPDASRYAKWIKPEPSGEEKKTVLDLTQLEAEYIRPAGHALKISMSNPASEQERRKLETDFRKKIQKFTSSSQPLHCLVESIEIRTPSALLGQGITLIDTPGLDDTERMRVDLTEEVVKDVDCILFLTMSGPSYGQAEKDFLLTQLRKGTVKKLVFVVTQFDVTYDKHVRAAEDSDEDPDPISVCIERERNRIQLALLETIEEVGGEHDTKRYREQVEGIEIAFTSAANHRAFLQARIVNHPIITGDPGGIVQAKNSIYAALSSESRLAASVTAIREMSDQAVERMLAIVENRRATMRSLRSQEEAERKLGNFRSEFGSHCKEFETKVAGEAKLLEKVLDLRKEAEGLAIDRAGYAAREVLAKYEIDDTGAHWRPRRGGRWGYLYQMESRIANAVFPGVQGQLQGQVALFGEFVGTFQGHLHALSEVAERICESEEISEEFELDIASGLESSLEESMIELNEIVEGEQERIISLLDTFVTDEVEQRISKARSRVADILGRGTTNAQTTEVAKFYREVRGILTEALIQHLSKRLAEFRTHLNQHAGTLPERAVSDVHSRTERASTDIRAAAEAAVSGQKEAFERYADKLVDELRTAMGGEGVSRTPATESKDETGEAAGGESAKVAPSTVVGGEGFEDIVGLAANLKRRYQLKENDTKWTFERLFPKDILSNATEVWIVDPYLEKPHQKRNLKELLGVLLTTAYLKKVNVVTGPDENGRTDAAGEFFDALDLDAHQQIGASIVVSRSAELHDRFVVFDNGCAYKLGRGLDIYKPATGLASARSELRKVRACEIDVFEP